jgi:hypothetical protein
MEAEVDPGLGSLVGSRARLLTLAVLANSDEPLSGYRIAKIASLPRVKVYPEIRKGIEAGILARDGQGYRMVDIDLRSMLRKRVRIRWDEEWDRARSVRATNSADDLERIRASLKGVRLYDPKNRVPRTAIRELERDPEKNRILRRLNLRPSARKD